MTGGTPFDALVQLILILGIGVFGFGGLVLLGVGLAIFPLILVVLLIG